MASTWSALKIELLETGQNSGTWGTLTNVNLGDAVLGEAITGSATVDFPTDADVTVTLTDSATSQSARNLRLNITESSTGVGSVRSLILGSGCQIEKFYLINNTGTGAKTVKNTTGTGISVPAGKATLVYNNGTNVVDAATYFTSLTLGSALPVASGGTGLTAGTSGGVLAFTATGTLASSTALAASALVIGGGAGAAPSTTTTGTGVVTALGVNVGTAGAFVVNGGALGSPASVGTMPAFTLGGTVSGGGNQINNVVIGASTPLAGSFTTLTASSTATLNTLVSSGATLTGGTINGMTVGATTASSGAFTSLTASTTLGVTGVSTLTAGAIVQGLTVGLGAGAVASNTAVGVSALAANTTGSLNTAIGYQALDANTTGITNTAVGEGSLGANITANNNTAVGRLTAALNTTGESLSVFGSGALYANTTGSYNTAVGKDALVSNTTASNNTAVGYQAGYSNTTGASNVYVGTLAGKDATSNSNVFVGKDAGLTVSSGGGNTYIGFGSGPNVSAGTGTTNAMVGYLSGNKLTTGSNNTSLGGEALFSNTTASNNTAVGYQAGYTNQTGIQNTFLGTGAGYTNNNNYNVFIGTDTGRFSTGTLNNFVGYNSGYNMTTGSKNTILGNYAGNTPLDIRTLNNYIVLSDGDGNLLISAANNQTVALQGAVPNAGTGITFPATQSASSNANTLDDYEEGTFTPTWTPSTSGTITLYTAYQNLGYTKVGRVVTITGANTILSVSSPIGTSVNITGLPFAVGSAFSCTSGTVALDLNTKTGVGIRASNTASSIDFYVNASTLGTNSDYAFSFSYITD